MARCSTSRICAPRKRFWRCAGGSDGEPAPQDDGSTKAPFDATTKPRPAKACRNTLIIPPCGIVFRLEIAAHKRKWPSRTPLPNQRVNASHIIFPHGGTDFHLLY